MSKFIISLMFLVSSFLLPGCQHTETKTVVIKNPTVEETLRLDKNADIFLWKDTVYQTDINWVDELKLNKKELVGEITKNFSRNATNSVKNGMANKLPIGAKIYSVKERSDILLVEFNGNVKNYLAIVEG